MNSKIKNYVDVLFRDLPNTRKAVELKEEILSTLNDHFEAHIAEGKAENQAYTEALSDLGDVDELLGKLAPEKELKSKIDDYRKVSARNTAIAVMLYFFGALALICFPGIASMVDAGNEDLFGIIGFAVLLVFCAFATGLLIYTKKSVPQDVEQYLVTGRRKTMAGSGPNGEYTEKDKFWKSFWKLYWLIVTIIYLAVSFMTGAWYITWLIWLIASAVGQAVRMFSNQPAED